MVDIFDRFRRGRRDPVTLSRTYTSFAAEIELDFESRYIWVYGEGNLEVQFQGDVGMTVLEIPTGNVLLKDVFAITKIGAQTSVPKVVVFA